MEASDAYTKGYVDGFYGRPLRSEEDDYLYGYAVGQRRNRFPSDDQGLPVPFDTDGSR